VACLGKHRRQFIEDRERDASFLSKGRDPEARRPRLLQNLPLKTTSQGTLRKNQGEKKVFAPSRSGAYRKENRSSLITRRPAPIEKGVDRKILAERVQEGRWNSSLRSKEKERPKASISTIGSPRSEYLVTEACAEERGIKSLNNLRI